MDISTRSKTYASYTLKLSTKHEQAFWSKVDKSGDCWTWTAYRNQNGYGQFSIDGKLYLSHRVSYRIHNADCIENLVVRHTCDNPSCVNPDHLESGSHKDNMKDMVERNRSPHCVLSLETVREIKLRLENGETGKALSEEYSVSKSSISRIKLSKSYGQQYQD